MEDEKVIITGSEGFIGSCIIDKFQSHNFSFLGIDKRANHPENNLDLTNFEDLVSRFNNYQPSIIFHTGTHSAGAYSKDFLGAYKEDSQALTNIMDYLSDKPDILLVFFRGII